MTNIPNVYSQMDQWNSVMFLYDSALKAIRTKIEILNGEFVHIYGHTPIEHIKSRLKTPDSIVKKLKRDGLEVTIDNMVEKLSDIAGIRIICSFTQDIYQIAEMIARQKDVSVLYVKDYIRQPKPNGYKSYHMVVTIPIYLAAGAVETKVEIQIRTVAMDFWASLEHKIYYKFEGNAHDSLQAAIDDLADSVEIDVQLSRDGVVVLGHDASLKRVAGVNRPISALNWEELQKLDVGSWFSSDFAGERIPALEEVLELCKGKINLNIELKNIGPESLLPEKTVELVMAHGMEEQCVITSASLNYLKDVKALEPQLRTGYIISAAYGNFYSSEAVDFISLRSGFVNEKLVENIHVQGKAIYAWTVNSKSEMERLVMLGVDGIITDRPVLAREIIYREEATENLMEYVRLVFK